MRSLERVRAVAVAFGALAAAGCGSAPQAPPQAAKQAPATEPPRITQFYATAPNLAKGEKELLCYGVENSRTVRLSPPAQELSAALSRCVEVNPEATTRYVLTAEGVSGPPATQELTVTVGPPHVRIIDVTVSSLSVAPNTAISLCYHVENAAAVEIEPIHYRGAAKKEGCATDTPQKTTTYLVTARGAEGSRDQEKVTVQVH